ncbi:hypothetical protein E2562_036346 [Oryza meyeriana var. granulata]|uniref:Uncharacterized protein n=1 Tax=Oryza meyeriana var. granulata TaxID=110450 RepID=A0A6G1CC28_9ORYZ|nr:hypothetical protein E2562_036346 [Oryza meyeriana var. granulata]
MDPIRVENLMHHGRAEVPYYFGKLSGSAENIEKFEDTLLLEFTREFEDEFRRYLPVYFNMLQEVDAMDDNAELNPESKFSLTEILPTLPGQPTCMQSGGGVAVTGV